MVYIQPYVLNNPITTCFAFAYAYITQIEISTRCLKHF